MRKAVLKAILIGVAVAALAAGVSIAAGKGAVETKEPSHAAKNAWRGEKGGGSSNQGEEGLLLRNGGEDQRVRAERCLQATEKECKGECAQLQERTRQREEECSQGSCGEELKQRSRLGDGQGGSSGSSTEEKGMEGTEASPEAVSGCESRCEECPNGDCARDRDQDRDMERLRLREGSCGGDRTEE